MSTNRSDNNDDKRGENIVLSDEVCHEEKERVEDEKLELLAIKQSIHKARIIVYTNTMHINSLIKISFLSCRAELSFNSITGVEVAFGEWLFELEVEYVLGEIALGRHILHLSQDLTQTK